MILSDVCEFIVDCPHSTAPDEGEGYPLIRTPNVGKGRLDLNGVHRVSESVYKQRIQRGAPRANDLIFAREAPAGNVALVQENQTVCLGQRTVLIRPNVQKVNPRYLVYYLLSPKPQYELLGTANGATVAHVNLPAIRNLKIELPDKAVQDKIGTILVTYDDLIENNQKQIKLLEEAAQRLYKEWFVDLRFPGHENTKIVDGVPEGWQIASIADICDTVGGGTPSTKIQSYYEKGDILWVIPTDITRNFSLALLDTEKKITPEGLKNSSAKMLPAETILMTSRASVGFFGMCKYEVCTNQGFISCIPKRENLQMYLLFNLKSRVEEIRQKAGGSTYLEISKTVFRELKIILPKDEVLAEYQKNVHDIFDEIYCRSEMIKSLVDMRNRLLPKLMSGEVEV